MRRRPAFTLVEMLVSVALILFIMVILTEAFGKGLESFRTLKAIGDMENRLRAASAVLRRDLAADHFEGKRRLSEDVQTWRLNGPPREGVFTVILKPGSPAVPFTAEGTDADGIESRRMSNWLLHFTSKARGNNRSEFYTAVIPANSPLLVGNPRPLRTTFFDQAADARFQDQASGRTAIYSSQWAELAYFLQPSGQTPEGKTLYTLYRCQFVMVADNSELNWPTPRVPIPPGPENYDEMACVSASTGSVPSLYFFAPFDAANNRVAFTWTNPLRAATPLLTEVVSFDVSLSYLDHEGVFRETADPTHPQMVKLSSLDRDHLSIPNNQHLNVSSMHAIKITLRVYEPKTKQSRQITLLQDL